MIEKIKCVVKSTEQGGMDLGENGVIFHLEEKLGFFKNGKISVTFDDEAGEQLWAHLKSKGISNINGQKFDLVIK